MTTALDETNPVVFSADNLFNRADLQRRWAIVQKSRHRLSSELKSLSGQVSGLEKSQLDNWSHWFGGEQTLESALHRPDILTLVAPILQSPISDELTDQDIDQFSQRSFKYANFNPSIRRRLFRIIRYPIAIVFVFAVIWFLFMFSLAPELRQVFFEFQIELSILADLFI